MIALDTNVLLRFLVVDQETPEHTVEAKAAISAAILAGEQVFVPITVLSEVVWLLVRTIKVGKEQAAVTLDVLAESREIVLDQRGAVLRALLRWRNGAAEFTDYLSFELAMGAGAREVLTFDKMLLRTPGAIRPQGPRQA